MELRNFAKWLSAVKSLDSRLPNFVGLRTIALALVTSASLTGCSGGLAPAPGVVFSNGQAALSNGTELPDGDGWLNPSPTPKPVATATPSASPTPTPSASPAATPTATPPPMPTPVPTPTPVPYQTCLADAEARFAQHWQNQMAFYLINGGLLPTPRNWPAFEKGTNGKVVVLQHGFLSSPEAMKELGDELKKEGYTIIRPLMTGFGAGVKAANRSNPTTWRTSIAEALDIAHLCHSDVSLIAHSLGGGVSADLIANRSFGGVSKLVLLAPYFRVQNDALRTALDVFLPFTDSITMQDLRKILWDDPYKLLGIERSPVGEPEPFLPLDAGNEVLDLGYVFDRTINGPRLSSPKTLLVITLADEVVSSKFAGQYVGARFSNLSTLVYAKELGIVHSFQNRAANPYFMDLVQAISNHLK